MITNVLGTDYTITIRKYADDEAFERNSISGYCNGCTKEIVVCDMATCKGWEHEDEDTVKEAQKETLRHEIVHAFFEESGLSGNSNCFDGAWARNEELIDWIALQGVKIHKAWLEVGAI